MYCSPYTHFFLTSLSILVHTYIHIYIHTCMHGEIRTSSVRLAMSLIFTSPFSTSSAPTITMNGIPLCSTCFHSALSRCANTHETPTHTHRGDDGEGGVRGKPSTWGVFVAKLPCHAMPCHAVSCTIKLFAMQWHSNKGREERVAARVYANALKKTQAVQTKLRYYI